MMTQSVLTRSANVQGNASAGTAMKEKQAGGFDLIFTTNLKSYHDSSCNTQRPADDENSSGDYSVSGNQNDGTEMTSEQKVQTNDAETETECVSSKEKKASYQSAKKTMAKEDEITTDEQVIARISELLQNIQSAVMELLNLSSEEFDQLLADQGMSITDLLQTENLQQVILANYGETDLSAALTDETLSNTMNELFQTVEELMTETDLKLTKEQMEAFLEEAGQTGMVNETAALEKKQEQEQLAKQPETTDLQNTLIEEGEKALDTDNVSKIAELTGAEESDSGAQTDTGRDDSNDMKSPDQFQTFVDNLVQASGDTTVNFSDDILQTTDLRDIANQIIEKIKISVSNDQTSMELQLKPENLGKVDLSVQSKNGVMTARFVVQNELCREAIESQLQTLRDTLNQQGLKVEAIEVTVAANAFSQNSGEESQENSEAQQNNSEGSKITMEEALNMDEMPEEEAVIQENEGMIGSTVDYTA